MHHHPAFNALILAAFAVLPAHAQDAVDPLDPGGALLEGDGLVEKKEPKAKVLADPDEKARDEVEARRSELEKRINGLQKRTGQYADSEEAMARVTAEMLKAFEKFFPKHNKLLETYRSAVRDNRDNPRKKSGKAIAALRKDFLKTLVKINAGVDKVEKLTAELEEKVKAEEAEDAEGGGEE